MKLLGRARRRKVGSETALCEGESTATFASRCVGTFDKIVWQQGDEKERQVGNDLPQLLHDCAPVSVQCSA